MATNTRVSKVVFGFPLPQYNPPWPFEWISLFFHQHDSLSTRKLDNGLPLGWAQTQSHVFVEGTRIPADVWTVRSWGLGQHAVITTYPHHNAEGAATFVIMESGVKNWVVFKVKHVTRYDHPDFLTQVSSNKADLQGSAKGRDNPPISRRPLVSCPFFQRFLAHIFTGSCLQESTVRYSRWW